MKILKPIFVTTAVFTALVHLFILAFLSYSNLQLQYDELTNQLYSKNSVVLSGGANKNWINLDIDKKYRLFAELTPIHRILIKNTSLWIPPMVSGYFPDTDSGVQGNVAVAGKNIMDTCLEKNNKKYLLFQDKEFEIVGVMGAGFITACDNLVILFGDIQFETDKFILDADYKSTVIDVANIIMAYDDTIVLGHNPLMGSARLTGSAYFHRLFATEVALLALLSLLICLNWWFNKKEKIRFTYKLFGIPTNKMILLEISEIFLLNALSTVFVLLIATLTNLSGTIHKVILIGVLLALYECLIYTVLMCLKVHAQRKG